MTTVAQRTHKPSTSTPLKLPQMVGNLLPEELGQIASKVRGSLEAFSTAKTLARNIESLRVRLCSHMTASEKVFRGRIIPRGDSGLNVLGDPHSLEQTLSRFSSERKRVVENVIIPSMSSIRNKYRGRTFSIDKQTPKELLYIAVPTTKVGSVVSFDVLKSLISDRFPRHLVPSPRNVEDTGRIRLLRSSGNKKELLELAYERPGRVSVYVNGKKVGKMWTDDAFKAAKAFTDGKPLKFRKKKTPQNYTIC